MTFIKKDWLGRATPGRWFMHYNSDWHAAHPGAWKRGEQEPGGFYAGDVWGSSTLEWDRAWFNRNGARMPKGSHHVNPRPGVLRIGTLGPGESVSFRISHN